MSSSLPTVQSLLGLGYLNPVLPKCLCFLVITTSRFPSEQGLGCCRTDWGCVGVEGRRHKKVVRNSFGGHTFTPRSTLKSVNRHSFWNCCLYFWCLYSWEECAFFFEPVTTEVIFLCYFVPGVLRS